MLAAIFIEILPETISIWTENRSGTPAAEAVLGAMTLLLAGYLVIQLFEHTIAPHFHFGAETHPESLMKPAAAYTAVGGLFIHTFFDGVSIAAAFLVSLGGLRVRCPYCSTKCLRVLRSSKSCWHRRFQQSAAGDRASSRRHSQLIGVVLLMQRSTRDAYALPSLRA